MALPNSFVIAQGTAVVWGTSGGAGVTNNILLDALAASAGRMGVYTDLGANFVEEYAVYLIIETGTAPTAGQAVELYLASTDDTSRWPGTVDGTDAAYTIANRFQIGPPVSVLYALATGNITQRQLPVIYRPPCRYVAPVVVNLMTPTLRDQTTASDNTSRVIMIPRALTMID